MLPKITIDMSKINGKCHGAIEVLLNDQKIDGVIRVDGFHKNSEMRTEVTLTILTDKVELKKNDGEVIELSNFPCDIPGIML